MHSANRTPWARALCITGIIRTLSCGGWVYITSSDDHDAHDVLMILYILCNVPWMLGNIACTPKEFVSERRRRYVQSCLSEYHHLEFVSQCRTSFSVRASEACAVINYLSLIRLQLLWVVAADDIFLYSTQATQNSGRYVLLKNKRSLLTIADSVYALCVL